MLQTLGENATRLCGADAGFIFRLDGDEFRLTADYGAAPSVREFVLTNPIPPGRGSATGRAALERRTIHIADVTADPEFQMTEHQRQVGFRTTLAVPMLRDGALLGVFFLWKTRVEPFANQEIELLTSFADQTVIAIENVRLFKELEAKNRDLTEALEQQTATSEILRLISSSPTDLQPVLDALAANAARLCEAEDASIYQVEGEFQRLTAHHGPVGHGGDTELMRIGRDLTTGRAVLDRQTIHVADLANAADEFPRAAPLAKRYGHHSTLATPLLREGIAVGAILIRRRELRPFTDRQVELLNTFAAQAVIAIENVRLFTELQDKNRALTEAHAQVTEALEQQTATAEILRVISSSPTDVQPVFAAIAESAVRLCDGLFSAVLRFDGEFVHLAAEHNIAPQGLETLRGAFPSRPNRGLAAVRAILDRAVVHVTDVEQDSEYRHDLARAINLRSILAVPMLREGVPIGSIGVSRATAGPFTDNQIALLQTFADQAVIAIENVRLFNETKEALEQQTATAEILRVISSSPTNVQPVFEAIAESAARLTNAVFGGTFLVADDMLHLGAIHIPGGGRNNAFIRSYPVPLDDHTLATRVAREGIVVNITDTDTEPSLPERQRGRMQMLGGRSLVIVPMVRDAQAVGMIMALRREPIAFTDKQVTLLQTFADQAVIAIENVRLFQTLEARNRDLTEALEQQTATSEVLKVISRSTFDLQPVLETLIENATRLCGAEGGLIARFDGGAFRMVAEYGASPEFSEYWRRNVIRPGRGSVTARAALERRTLHVVDVLADPEYDLREAQRVGGYRSVLCVPMLRQDDLIGLFVMWRTEVRAFTDKQIGLITTFADQAVIAIENVRLLQELQARTRELGRSVEELKALGEVSRAVSSTLDLETVLATIVSRAGQLAGADGCAIYEYDEPTHVFYVRATHGIHAALVETLRTMPLRKGEGVMGRATETREPMQIADIEAPGVYQSHLRDILIGAGYRALLSVPLLREEQIIGSLSLNRKTPGEFPPEIIEVLKTFATQSALAIQNARLFREIADKSLELETASRHKSEFLANMSHELRTPLNAILGFSEVLAERMFGEVNEKQAEYLQDILASGRHLLSLINDILDLSKVEAGRLELELTTFDLSLTIENVLTFVRERATRHGITLDQVVDARLGEIVGDERKVKQVLINLLSNAVKFTPAGGRVGITARHRDGRVEIAVSDTGIGIAPEDQAAIFEEFRQAGRDDARKQEGTGLGLTLAKKFVELHGGQIWVRSQVGQGSTFTFTLPVRSERTSSSE